MGKSKYADLKQQMSAAKNVKDVAKRNADLEATRESLMTSLLEFKGLLSKATLLQNMTSLEKQAISKLMERINNLSTDLSNRNLGEGALVMGTAALNSILLLHEEINQLKFHNFYLTKRLDALELKPKAVESQNESSDKSG